MRSQSALLNRSRRISSGPPSPRRNRRWRTAMAEAVCGVSVGPTDTRPLQRCQVDLADSSTSFQPMTRRHQPDARRGEMEAGQGLEPCPHGRALWDEQECAMQNTQQIPSSDARQETIVQGPSKFELMLALFDHTMVNGRTVAFSVGNGAARMHDASR